MQKSFPLLALLLSSSLIASSEVDALFDMSLEDLMNIEITGSTKTTRNALNVPASVSVYTHKEIKNLGVSTLEELKNYVPGFTSRRSGDNSLSRVSSTRGFQSGTASRDILVLVDGQRLNADWSGGSSVNDTAIALENIQRVEFMRGASSSIYGSNAFSGVINLITIKDKNTIDFKANDSTYNTSALLSLREGEFNLSGFVKRVDDGGQTYNNLSNPDPSGTTTAKDTYDTLDLYIQTHYKGLNFYASHKEVNIDDFYVLKFLDNDNKREITSDYLRLTYDFEIGRKFNSQIATSYMMKKSYFEAIVPSIGNSMANLNENDTSVEWFNSYKINSNQSLEFGAEYRHMDMMNTDATYIDISPTKMLVGKEDSRDVYGVFVQYQAYFFDSLNVVAGLRYDEYSDFGDTYNPRLAIVYEALDKTSIKFLYSSAFRAPSRVELDTVNNPAIVGNENLNAEKMQSYEAILVHKEDTQTFTLSAFRNEVDDMIITEASGVGNIATYTNNGHAHFSGIEFEYSALFFKFLNTRLGYTNVFSKPDDSSNTPQHTGSAIINYNFSKINFNISGYFNSSVENDFGTHKEKLDSYTIVNSKISYEVVKNAKVYMHIKNLFDETYYTPTNGSNLTVNMPNRGLEGFVGLEYNF